MTDLVAWALQIAQVLFTALLVLAVALLLWTLWQPTSCSGNQDYSTTNFTGGAPVVMICHNQRPLTGGR